MDTSINNFIISFLLFLGHLMYALCSKELCFGVVGDIGGMPKPPFQTVAQKKVANLLAKLVAQNNCQFIVGVGDNFYFNGVKNVEDPRFFWTYERTYSQPALKVPWYMIAGNHDHNANVSAQIAYTKISRRWNFPDFFYRKIFPIPDSKKTLELLMIDTTMLCWHNKKSNSPSPKVQWKWIEDTLKESKADYLIVAGHHPMYSGSNHGNTKCLVQRLKPLFEKYSVNAYFSGHDHNLQHIHESDSDVHYFISGSGNFVDQRFNNRHILPLGSSKFEYADNCGFNLIHITKDSMKLHTFTVEPGRDLGSIYDVIINPRTLSKQSNAEDNNDQLNFMLINNGGNQGHEQSKGGSDNVQTNDQINPSSNVKLNDKIRSNGNLNKDQNFGTTATTTTSLTSITNRQEKTTHDDFKRTKDDKFVGNKTEERPTPPPTKLIDTNKLTIDNLSDIPLSSYSSLQPLISSNSETHQDVSAITKTKSLSGKTGNNLKDFILERLPAAAAAAAAQKVSTNSTTNVQPKNKSSDNKLYTNTSTSMIQKVQNYQQPNSNYLFNNIQTAYTGFRQQYPMTNYYYQTPYQQQGYQRNQIYNYWGANNNIQYPTVQVRQDAYFYQQQQVGYLGYQQRQKPVQVETSTPAKKTKRETVVQSKAKDEILSNFFENQNSKSNIKSSL